MIEPQGTIDYSMLQPRRASFLTMKAFLLFPGVRKIVRQIEPYAAAWKKSNTLALQKTTGPLWIVLGDSTAQSIGAPSIELGWVGQLDKIMKESGKNYRLANLSFTRARTDDVLTKQIPIMNKLGAKPDLVTLFIGYNDLSRRKLRVNLARNLTEIINNLPKGSVIGLIPAQPSLIKPYNNLILQQAKAHGLKVADIPKALGPLDRSKYASDHYHPNEKGYADYARAFAIALGIKG